MPPTDTFTSRIPWLLRTWTEGQVLDRRHPPVPKKCLGHYTVANKPYWEQANPMANLKNKTRLKAWNANLPHPGYRRTAVGLLPMTAPSPVRWLTR